MKEDNLGQCNFCGNPPNGKFKNKFASFREKRAFAIWWKNLKPLDETEAYLYFLKTKYDDHFGDCTKESQSCMRCLYETCFERAK